MKAIQNSLNSTLGAYPPLDPLEINEKLNELIEKFQEEITAYSDAIATNASASFDAAENAGGDIGFALLGSLMETFGFEAPEDEVKAAGDDTTTRTFAALDTATLIVSFDVYPLPLNYMLF
jgi:hypothetical protein